MIGDIPDHEIYENTKSVQNKLYTEIGRLLESTIEFNKIITGTEFVQNGLNTKVGESPEGIIQVDKIITRAKFVQNELNTEIEKLRESNIEVKAIPWKKFAEILSRIADAVTIYYALADAAAKGREGPPEEDPGGPTNGDGGGLPGGAPFGEEDGGAPTDGGGGRGKNEDGKQRTKEDEDDD